MKNFVAMAIKVENQVLKILDQTKLPEEEVWISIDCPTDMEMAIKQLKVRGAPLIGVAAGISLAQYAEKGVSEGEYMAAAKLLRESRPTAVNLMYVIDFLTRFESTYNVEEVISKAEKVFAEDVELCQKIANNGSAFVEDGDNILTHCNTGGLATAGMGTALGVIQKAYQQGKNIHVYVDETRPLLQGGRLTTWELTQLGIPYTLICDNMAASLMAQGRVQKVFVGADRIAVNGDFANKIGTYGLAVSCQYHKVPFYCVAPYTTIDFDCRSGAEIPIELRSENEVRGVRDYIWAPEQCEVYNPAFDVTPNSLVSAWIFDKRVYTNDDLIKEGGLCSQ